ncbi:MAG: Xaa-Pro peptidase family protein [Chlamydiota bacterium]
MNIREIQKQLLFYKIDGWLLYDLHRRNPLALSVLQIPPEVLMTRRCFYWIPAKGTPRKIVHKIEAHNLDHLPGEKKSYLVWKELRRLLGETLSGIETVAMEYSPDQAIPTVSVIDGGLVDLVRGYGVKVVSSAPFLQSFTCLWSDEQYLLHKEAVTVLERAVDAAWDLIGHRLACDKPVNEYQVQQFILEQFEKEGCVTEGEPICGVNENAADPHYCPKEEKNSPIERGDLILIDLWCRKDLPDAVFADITRMGIAADQPTTKQQQIFSLVRQAQQAGTDLIIERYAARKEIRGREVDEAVRRVIDQGGYGEYFTHRTGHNIHTVNHGPGANLDSIETDDHRPLIPGTCFSIEPGIYLPKEFGIRLEYNVYIHPSERVEITSPLQENFVIVR